MFNLYYHSLLDRELNTIFYANDDYYDEEDGDKTDKGEEEQ